MGLLTHDLFKIVNITDGGTSNMAELRIRVELRIQRADYKVIGGFSTA